MSLYVKMNVSLAGDVVEYLEEDVNGNLVSKNDGADELTGTNSADVIAAGKGNDTIKGLGGNDTLYGGDGDDTVHGSGGADRLYGGRGNDRLYGEEGDDSLYGDMWQPVHTVDRALERDMVIPRDQIGDDMLDGGAGRDYLYGGFGNDKLYGGDGQDKLYGGRGDDWLYGGKGDDVMVDSEGQNVFVWRKEDLGGQDDVWGFCAARDKIRIEGVLAADADASLASKLARLSLSFYGENASLQRDDGLVYQTCLSSKAVIKVLDADGSGVLQTINLNGIGCNQLELPFDRSVLTNLIEQNVIQFV